MGVVDDFLRQMGPSATARLSERLKRAAFVPVEVLQSLSEQVLHEEWGHNSYVLVNYLAAHVAWQLEQGRFSCSADDTQIYVSAGHLQTRYGTPVFLIFEKNRRENVQPWVLKYAGSNISAPALPQPALIPAPAAISPGAEVVMSHEHILDDNVDRVQFLSDTPKVAQMCAVAGAIQWSINRGLQIPYYYFGRMNYLVPLYLTSREDITKEPDLVAPIEVAQDAMLVRTVLLPHMPYPRARLAVRRHDQLPHWLLDGWHRAVERSGSAALDDDAA